MAEMEDKELREEWNKLFSQLEKYQRGGAETLLRQLEELVIEQGIPQDIRGKLWMTISGASQLKLQNENLYEELLSRRGEVDHEGIEMDTKRLKLNEYVESHLEEPKSSESIKSILIAWSIYDQEVGYVQGMTYIVASIFVTVVINSKIPHTEEDAFWLFVSLMNSYGLRNLHNPKSPALFELLNSYDEVFKKTLPDLYRHFKKERCTPELYAVECFTSFFAYNLNVRSLLRIWDLLFMRFPTILSDVLVAVLFLAQDELNSLPLEDLIPQLRARLKQTEPDALIPLIKDPPTNDSIFDCSIT